uniref:FAF domain-containing protein n=1 Tax=Leersia perrieri TaxID=77586 RepID=A0A0D9VGN5_9ORYZ
MAATTTCRGHPAAAAAVMPPPLLFELDLGGGAAGAQDQRRRHYLGLCTEGLGTESSESSGGDVDLGSACGDVGDDDDDDTDRYLPCKRQHRPNDDDEEETAVAAAPLPAWTRRAFPPPISVIGAGGKPWLYLRAQRGDGRLVLREVRIPSRELLHARREDGRFKLHFAHPDEQQQQQQEEEQLLLRDDQDPAEEMIQEQVREKNE